MRVTVRQQTFNLEEAANFLKMSPSALRQKTKKGDIKGAKPAKRWVYLQQDLVDYIRSQYTVSVEIPLSDSQFMEKQLCHYTNGKKAGGFASQPQADREYAALLGLTTNPKRKSTTID